MASSVAFGDLPPNVQSKIVQILKHRKRISRNLKNAAREIMLVSSPLGLIATIHTSDVKKGIAVASLAAISLGGIQHSSHSSLFRKEYLELFHALRSSKDHPAVKQLLEKYPFVVVNPKGGLVGKKTNPVILRQPIGRRRIASPFLPPPRIKKWHQKLPPRRGRKL